VALENARGGRTTIVIAHRLVLHTFLNGVFLVLSFAGQIDFTLVLPLQRLKRVARCNGNVAHANLSFALSKIHFGQSCRFFVSFFPSYFLLFVCLG
jgi:hypothetical protein